MQTAAVPSRPLRLLLLEDQATDAELCERELKRAGLVFDTRCVATRTAFEAALDQFTPDLIISDFSLPNSFNGLAALEISRQKLPHVPFIFVSGTIGEERAVEAMRRGATDYVLKDRLNRLVPVVKRVLDEVHERAARQSAEAEVRKHEQRIARLSRFRSVLSSISSAIVRVRDRDQLLMDACRIAVEEGQFLLAWVGALDRTSLEIRPSAWHGRNGTFLGKLDSSIREDLPG